MTKNKNRISVGKVAAISAGVAVIGAGAYYFLGPKGEKHQKEGKKLLVEMKIGVRSGLSKVKSITKPIYYKMVDAVVRTYNKKYKEHKSEINVYAKKLKEEWKNLQHKVSPIIKKTKKVIENNS